MPKSLVECNLPAFGDLVVVGHKRIWVSPTETTALHLSIYTLIKAIIGQGRLRVHTGADAKEKFYCGQSLGLIRRRRSPITAHARFCSGRTRLTIARLSLLPKNCFWSSASGLPGERAIWSSGSANARESTFKKAITCER